MHVDIVLTADIFVHGKQTALSQVIVEELVNGIFFTYTDVSSSQIMNSDGSCVKSG